MYRILYVDDESAVLGATKAFLEKNYQFMVDPVISGKEALESINNCQYDAIVSDYEMPGMNGIDLLRIIRGSGSLIPFIIFTGRGREDVVIDALNEGADFYIQKGGNVTAMFAELANHIRQAASRRRAEDETNRNLELLESSYEELTATEEELRQNLDELVQSQKQIKEKERLLSDIINFLPDATFVIDREGKVIAWNRAMEGMTGIPGYKMLKKGNYEYSYRIYGKRRPLLIDLILDEELQDMADYPKIFRSGEKLYAETYIEYLNKGKGAYVWGTASLLYDDEGNIIGAIESIRDVSERKKMELALKESEERYRNVVEGQTEFVTRFLPDGTHVFVNEAYCNYFGIDREEMIGQRFIPEIPPEDKNSVKEHFASLDRDHPVDSIEHRIIMPGGEVRWQRWSDRAIFDEEGNIIEYQSVGRDITEIKIAEEKLRESEELYRTIFESTSSPTVIVDEDTKLSLVNEEFAQLAGYAKDDLEGKKSWTEFVAGEDLERMKKYHYSRRIEKDSVPRNYEFHFIDRSGKIYNIYLTISVIPGTKKSVASFLDITELKRAEKELKESELRYRNIVEDQTEFVCRFLPDGTHVFVNEAYCSYFGKNRDEMVGNRFSPKIPPVDKGRLNEFFSSLTPDHPVDSIRHRIIMPDGEVRWQRWSDRAIFDEKGNIIEYQSVGRDITDIIRSEESLRNINEKLKLLSSITRHDILNQITALNTYEELLKQYVDNETVAGFLEQMIDSTKRIEDQIVFTRDYQDLGLKSPSWQMIGTMARAAVMPTIARLVDVDIDIGTLEIFADPMLEKVFVNLFDNAIRHGGKVTSIKISFEEAEDHGIIVFEDDGMGVDDDMKEKIFHHGVGSHTGFGLFLVREILDITGISIRETGIPGKGARFEIIVPYGMYRFDGESNN